jgi:predicted TIM-barrel fold metal-dependent hydrolase
MSPHAIHHAGCGCGLSRRGLLGAAAGAGALSVGVDASAQPAGGGGGARPGKRGPWVDAHVHLQAPEWFAGNVFERPAPRKRRRTAPQPPGPGIRGARSLESAEQAKKATSYGPTLAEQTRRLLDEMDAAGIDTAVLMAMDYDYTGKKLRVQHWEQLVALAQVRDAHPGRFVLFAAVDPRRGAGAVELLRRAKRELNIAGMGEFAPHFFGFAPNDRERCYPIYQACAELDLMVAPNCSIVTSHISRWCDPIYFEDVANDFPTINISLTSAGYAHWTETAITLAASKPNVYLDVGDWQARFFADPVDNVIRYVRRCLDTDARHKIMFGSDHPVYNRTVSEKAWVEVFTVEAAKRGMAFTDEELHLFFSDNAQEFLDMDLVMPAKARR